jgi:ATP-dependent Clp protease ATP-binding subunit ClpA
MFERYPETSRRALFVAKAIALAAGAQSIDAEDLLAGALDAWSDAGSFRDEVFRRIGLVGPVKLPRPTDSDIPFSAVVKHLLNDAMMRADRLGHHRIRPEHLLLALLDDQTCAASGLLHDVGLKAEMLIKSLARHSLEDDGPLPYDSYLSIGDQKAN